MRTIQAVILALIFVASVFTGCATYSEQTPVAAQDGSCSGGRAATNGMGDACTYSGQTPATAQTLTNQASPTTDTTSTENSPWWKRLFEGGSGGSGFIGGPAWNQGLGMHTLW